MPRNANTSRIQKDLISAEVFAMAEIRTHRDTMVSLDRFERVV